MTIAVVDYRMGNRRSVEKALEHVGARVMVTRDHRQLHAAQGLVVPGVGAFPQGMANLKALGLDELLKQRAQAGTPLLGICLGMQLLFDGSEELEPTEGLGLIPGDVTQIKAGGLPIPHIGWNHVDFVAASPLTGSLPPGGAAFYHVHSFAARPRESAHRGRHDGLRRTLRDHRRPRARLRRPVSPREIIRQRPEPARMLRRPLRTGASTRGSRPGMILWPAVDILGGKAVRLERGRFDTETVYDQDPLEAARRWAADGARALHIVDLDGARTGRPVNLEHVERIAKAVEVPVQVGGGLRSAAAVKSALDAGAQRVIIGTAAYTDLDLLRRLVDDHGEQVTVSLDARQGKLAGCGLA